MINRVRTFRIYDDIGQRISDMQSDLARTRRLVERAERRSQPQHPLDTPAWTGMTSTQIAELKQFMRALEGYVDQLSVSEDNRRLISEARRAADTVGKEFDSARLEYDRLVNLRQAATAADQQKLDQASERLRRHVERLWSAYDAAKKRMLDAGDRLLETAASESRAAGDLAGRFEYLSWVLYVIGTLIVLYGRFKSVVATKPPDG